MMSLIQTLNTVYLHGLCNCLGDFAVSDVTFKRIGGEIAYHAHRALGNDR